MESITHYTNIRDSLPKADEVTITKVRAHVEKRISDESQWSTDEIGNAAADRMTLLNGQKFNPIWER